MSDKQEYVISPRERELLDVIQDGIIVTERPFKVIGERVGMSEREVIEMIFTLTDNGIIRNFGPVFDARRLGYVSTLAAAQVEEERVAEVAAALLDITEITHNYLRDNDLNMWFTVTAHTQSIKSRIITFVKRLPGVTKAFDFPSVKRYKIRAVFGSTSDNNKNQHANLEPVFLEESDIELIRHLQRCFPVVEKPFTLLAETMNRDEESILQLISSWMENGTIRRFGARLNHRKSGYRHNSMVAWKGGDIEELGKTFAEMSHVTHCYRRKTVPEWQYELYTMVHGRTDKELSDHIAEMHAIAEDSDYLVLNSLYELKKTSMSYFEEEARWDSLTGE